ncbi:MAG: hypothetical protein EBR23_08990, partial [Planctomycetia bacterium]|nr:hypothetical protein [Planctomycetia bacterium]
TDGGRTWGPRSTLEENTGRENVMSVSFLRSRSGDVLFACVLAALYQRGDSLDAAVRRALPYAAANAAHPGIAEFPEPAA